LAKIPLKETNKRRDKVWFLMLKGYNRQSIVKTLGSTQTVIYNDINYLTDKSKQYVYDMTKGTHVLMYQRAIEGVALALSEAWDKFNDPKVPEKQKLGYLRLTTECNEKRLMGLLRWLSWI
jgi:succinate dehydrogenase/fumarate reductase flavoprotein subunit